MQLNNFIFPIKMSVHWLAKAIFIAGVVMFLAFAIFAYSDTQNIKTSLFFIGFALLNSYTLLSSLSTISIENDSVTLYSPPRGTFKFYWSDLKWIETNGSTFAFVGENKHLAITLGFVGKGKKDFFDFLQYLIEERRCEVRPLSSMFLTQKNTKVT